MVSDWNAGRRDEAADFFYRHVPLMRFEFQEGIGMAIRKEMLKRRGALRHAGIRQPGAVMDRATTEALDRILTWLDLEGEAGRAFYPEEHGVPPYDELVFVANRARTDDPALIAQARDPRSFEGFIKLPDGTAWGPRWVVTEQGVMLTVPACGSCHRGITPTGAIMVAGPGGTRPPGSPRFGFQTPLTGPGGTALRLRSKTAYFLPE